MIGWAAACVAAACSSEPVAAHDPPKASDVVQLRWIAKDADRVAALTTRPRSCELGSTDPDVVRKRMLGKMAFESPALLGGAAARMELSCSACHLNGRGNPDFFLEGLSDKPGTADVTSSIFSKVRGNGAFDPVVIPDIAMRDGKQMRDRTGAEFRAKVHGLIVEEFDGQEPPPAVLDAVIAYLDSLSPGACRGDVQTALVERELFGAETALEAGKDEAFDTATRLFYLRVARLRLERIHERYGAPEHADIQRRLSELSAGMASLAEAIRADKVNAAASALWTREDWNDMAGDLLVLQGSSLYDPGALRAALAREGR